MDIPLQTRSNVRGIFVLLIRDLGLIVEVLGAQSLELLTGVLLAFSGSVVVAQSTCHCQFCDGSQSVISKRRTP